MANKFVIEVVAKGFRNLESQLGRADKATKGYEKSAGKARGTTSGLRREIGALRNNLLLYTFAIGSAARITGNFIKAASDLEENISAFKQVFGESSQEAMNFANALSTSFGRSKSDIISLMVSLQDTFVPLGFSREQARKLSQALTQLSFDVGSFKNVASPEVANAFTSAIVGNHEAVRRFGIVLTEARLKDAAFRLGISDTKGELNAQQKVLARTALIFEGTADQQGDVIKTQEEFANQLRNTQAEFKRLKEDIGAILLPIAKLGLEFATTARIKGYAAALSSVAVGFAVVRLNALRASFSLATFKLALIKTGIGAFVILAGELAARFLSANEVIDKGTNGLADYKKVFEDINTMVTKSDAPKRAVKMVVQVTKEGTFRSKEHLKALEDANQRHLTERHRTTKLAQAEIDALLRESAEKDKRLQEEKRDAFLAAQAEIKAVRDQMSAEEDFQLQERRRMILEAMEEQKRVQEELDTQTLKSDREKLASTVRVATGFRQFSDMLGQAVLDGQDFGDAFMRSLDAITAKIAAEFASFAILSLLTGGTAKASQLGFSTLGALIGHTGGRVTNKGVQAFANGGAVQGRDNVPILAQAGEYIIKRDSAESIGLDKLNEINETGQTGSLTVNISAPLVDETVIDTIIPAIQKASRFNLA